MPWPKGQTLSEAHKQKISATKRAAYEQARLERQDQDRMLAAMAYKLASGMIDALREMQGEQP